MSPHRAIIEVGPGSIRRLCCGTSVIDDAQMRAALEAIDDRVALVGERPVAVESLWRTVLESLPCDGSNGLTIIHPSWWPPARIGVLTTAAPRPNDLAAQPRSWLLAQGWSDTGPDATVVEIAERLVAVTSAPGGEVVAVPRTMRPTLVAQEVASLAAATKRAVVVIDASDDGMAALTTSIAEAVRHRGAQKVIEIDDARLRQLARLASLHRWDCGEPPSTDIARDSRSPARRLGWLAAAGVVVVAAVPAVGAAGRREMPNAAKPATTFLVEGQVAVTVPANWSTRRLTGGPGSARVELTSPSDPEVALHVTQTPIPGETLSRTAERLKRAIDAEPAGIFVDFNPSGTSAGRPAVTYRELRAGHQVRWTVLLDGPVRISVGCQSRPGGEDAVREVCEQAVRSARAISEGTKPAPQRSE
ncbi:type VII secretion-associated protein [Mycobacterium conspicuum]|uniref:type VII secretion-associated protein n=1 Tax=Mycobacterium conspicuum TaxID=44010 RepID=UPI000A160472|nr:type VII secretion-associated protein [Mycobacterium conspicuum]ORV41617.1 Type VII secretion-associated protein [Mycobacterium conspicuum]